MCGHMGGVGRQSGAQELGFAARQKGLQPQGLTHHEACMCPHPLVCVFICHMVRLLALLPGHWDGTMRKSEDSVSGLAHAGAHCMLVLAP